MAKQSILRLEKSPENYFDGEGSLSSNSSGFTATLTCMINQVAIVVEADLGGKILAVNDNFSVISGFTRTEAIGKTLGIVSSGFHSRDFINGIWQTISSGRVWCGEILNRSKNGALYWVQTTIIPVIGCEKSVERYIGIQFEMTNRRSAMLNEAGFGAYLNESRTRYLPSFINLFRDGIGVDDGTHRPITSITSDKRRYFNLYECAPFGYMSLDREGIIIEANKKSVELLVGQNGDLIGRELLDFVSTKSREVYSNNKQKFGGKLWSYDEFDLQMVTLSGLNVWARMQFSDGHSENSGETITLVTICDISVKKDLADKDAAVKFSLQLKREHDISIERASLNEQMVRASAVAKDCSDRATMLHGQNGIIEENSRVKSEFIANMSHEIRSPLSVIRGYTELLTHDIGNEAAVRWVATVLRASQQLEILIADILDLSRIEAGKITVNESEVVVDDLVGEIIDAVAITAEKKGVVVTKDISRAVPAMVFTDALRVKQILHNIVGNAMKFTDHGGVHIAVTVDDNPIPKLRFVVSDSGIGMTQTQMQRIFGMFCQGDSSVGHRFGGTGLGLALSRHLAGLLGGDVTLLWSELDRGSAFAVTLALKLPPRRCELLHERSSEEGPSDELPAVIAAQQHKVLTSLDGLKVLICDDSDDIRLLMRHVLSALGAVVTEGVHGIDAVDACLSGFFHIVLLDLEMPKLGGAAAIKQLRDAGCTYPVFAMTSHVMTGESERCLAAGFTGYIAKPVDFDRLIMLARSYLPL